MNNSNFFLAIMMQSYATTNLIMISINETRTVGAVAELKFKSLKS